MPIVSLVGSRIRCYPEILLEGLGPKNLFVAENGAGKSTLLEMLFFLSRGRSFRTGITREMQAWGSSGFGLAGGFEEEPFHRLKIEWEAGKRSYTVDENPVAGLAQYWGRWPVVAFSNEDLALVRGGSAGRRAWSDSAIAGGHPQHLTNCLKAQRLVKQKNALLKQPRPDRGLWSVLQDQLRSATGPIQDARQASAATLSGLVTEAYHQLSEEKERLVFVPQPNRAAEWEPELLWERERAVGRTLYGPHRDDWSILLRGRELKKFGSEGQQKSAALAMRLAEVAQLSSQGRVPAILADDAVQELDEGRRRNFWELLPPQAQWFVTGTSRPEFSGAGEFTEWSARGGQWSRA